MKLSLVCERKNFVDEMNKKVAVGVRVQVDAGPSRRRKARPSKRHTRRPATNRFFNAGLSG
jgi:hypothetical protein